MHEFNVPPIMLEFKGNPMNILAVEEYGPNNLTLISGLQNYHALLWIRKADDANGTQFDIAKRRCTVSFYSRKDDIFFAEYVDLEGVAIFQQAIFKNIQMEIRKDCFLVDFECGRSLEAGQLYKLFLIFSNKQKYDRAQKWYKQGLEQPH